MEYKICEAAKGNLEEVVPLWRELMEIHKELDPASFAGINEELYKQELLEHYISDTKEIFVSIYNGLVVGYITASIWTGFRYNTIKYCTIGDLMVDSHFRKEGIGTSLIETVKNWAKQKNAERIELSLIHKNTKGYEFFKRYGFQDSWHQLDLKL